VAFQATVTGGAPLSYQWRFNGAKIRGATNTTLTLTNVLAVNAGSYTVLVSNSAGSLLSDAATLSVAKREQAIVFGVLSNRVFGDAPFALDAKASSGLPVRFEILSGPATISGNTLTPTGAGLIIVRAFQAGNADYNAAPSVDQSFTVAPASQPPTAKLNVASITVAGGRVHELEVRYSDDKAIRLSTLDSNDLRVTGPNGYEQLAAFDYVDIGGDGTPRTGYYHVDAPGGAWDSADNGAYTVLMEPNQVSDTSNVPVAAGVLGTFEIKLTVVARPPNDDFTNRIHLVGSSVAAEGTNLNASQETGEPNHAGKPATRSVWWSWTAPQSGPVTISTSGSSIDTLLSVYAGATVANLVPVANNDDDPDGGSTSRVTFRAEAGTEYQIAVDAFGGEAGSIKLSLMLVLSCIS